MTPLVVWGLLSAASALHLAPQIQKCEQPNYVMAYHLEGPTWLDSDGMHIAHSIDGLNWEPVKGNYMCAGNHTKVPQFCRSMVLKPEVGMDRYAMAKGFKNEKKVMRDPFLIQDPKTKKVHALWTTGWASQTIGYASSDDLVNWSHQRELAVMKPHYMAINTWAPEAIYDDEKEEFVIFWATAKGETWMQPKDIQNCTQKMWYTTTKDFEKFTPAKVLFHPGHSIIDATMKKVDGKYLMFYKNAEKDRKTLHMAISSSPTGGWEKARDIDTHGTATEGPSLVQGKDGKWLLYQDFYQEGKYGVYSSASAEGPWEDISDSAKVPKGARHATVLKLAPKTLRAMAVELDKVGMQQWARPKVMSEMRGLAADECN